MGFVELVVLVCSLASPPACQEKHLLFESSGSLDACLAQAQPYLARWIGEHPNLRVAKYHCAWPGSDPEKS